MKRTKQVILARHDLKMNRGKLAAQVAHASMAVILNMMPRVYVNKENGEILTHGKVSHDTEFCVQRPLEYKEGSFLSQWLDGQFTKVVLKVHSEKELREFQVEAALQNLPNALIEDCGYTQFDGVKTVTTCAIGPCDPNILDKLTGHLKLYN